jgi:hypothetical protein
MKPRAYFPWLGVVLGYVCAATLFTWPLARHLDSALTGDPAGDAGVYVWNQWVFQHEALVERRNPLTTEQILSLTQRVDLTQHNYTAFLDLLALPLIPWLGVVTTFNVVFLLATVLTALATYALVRRVTAATAVEAWLAGALFAWSPVLVARSAAHFSLVAAAPLPAFLLFLINADRTRRLSCAALTGLCMAWAAFCDVYYAVYCLLIAVGYITLRLVRVSCGGLPARRLWRWTLDVLIMVVAGLIVGLLFGRGGRFELFGLPVSIRGLYTPVLILTTLVIARALVALRPHFSIRHRIPSRQVVLAAFAGFVACAGPLAPVISGLSERGIEGRYMNPSIPWRSSPRGVDLLGLFEVNPASTVVRLFHDAQRADVMRFVDFTAALSLVALGVVAIAVWRAAFRPRAGWIWLTTGFALVSLGPFLYVGGVNTMIPLPWALLRYVPIIGATRSPARFAVGAALGLAVLFAGALAALGQRYPDRRRYITAVAGALLLVELFPAPRMLYSAEIPAFYRAIAADPRPVRIVELPFGVRDGVSSAGNFSARYQYYQTLHGKKLMGGYLSRISKKRLGDMRAQPTLDALLTLSEGQALAPDHAARIRERAPGFLRRANVGYVVIDQAAAPRVLSDFVVDAWHLEEIERLGNLILYRPAPNQR